MFKFPAPINAIEPVSTKRKSRLASNYNYNYTILQYSFDDEDFTLLTDEEQYTAFAYMPPRQTANITLVCEESSDVSSHLFVEAIEGTMITFFWNAAIGKWEICTRNGVGGNYSFARLTFKNDPAPKTFREMVLDVFRSRRPETVISDLSDIEELSDLNTDYCYTCILQHPENHIVYSRTIPRLNLVAVHDTFAMPPLVDKDAETPQINAYIEEVPLMKTRAFSCANTSTLKTVEEIAALKRQISASFAVRIRTEGVLNIFAWEIDESPVSLYYPPAWIITDKQTGHRCELANPYYESAKLLRSMQPNMRYQYLHLTQLGIVGEYLNAFPQYMRDFQKLSCEYDLFITGVYNAYVKFYIKKERVPAIPKKFFVHAAGIHHGVYLSPENGSRKITRETVIKYFKGVTPSKMFYNLTRDDDDESITTYSPAVTEVVEVSAA
jgi:hypothetical protein